MKKLIFATVVGLLGALAWILAALILSLLVIFMGIGTNLSFGSFINRNFSLFQQLFIFGPALFILAASIYFIFVQDQPERKA